DGGQAAQLGKILKSYKFTSVLDIGCGTGDFCNVTDKRYVGVDATPSFVEYSQKKFGSKTKKFYVMDATKMNFKRNEFEASMLVDFIHHLPDDLVVDILKDAARVSKKAVIIWDAVPPTWNPIRRMFYALDRGAHMRPLQKQIDLVKKSGVLDVVKVDTWRSRPGFYIHSIIICKPKKK
ncbi:MAG TPA: class I SAM-dependent methyltransferase, partial [Candidatus Nanoarchaeia archaeon]|nr:class I SAM-dependent methyltransferase [Candidatus Nanoarchaeia archaeon]